MSEFQVGKQTAGPRAEAEAEPAAGPAPGKSTLVELEERGLVNAHGGVSPGRAAATAAAAGPRGEAAPVTGPGPRTGLGAFAAAIAAARGPRDLQRAVPQELLARHGLLPRSTAAATSSSPAGSAQIRETAARGASGAGGALPYLDLIQRSFGRHDVSGIRAHSDQAATRASQAMGAEAYAAGDHVAFARAPSLHTAAHEAAHVVQQRAGVQLSGGVGQAGDRYEQHANRVADAVVRGESSEALLDELVGARGGEASGTSASATGSAVQHQVDAVQFELRATVDQARNGRGVDTPAEGTGGQHGAFQDQAPDDHGPVIRHDHGHLDDGSGNIDESRRRDPTWADHFERAKWIAKLEAAELLRPDLVDGTAAYRHFLFGNGAERDIQYGRFLANDSSGATVLASALEDTRQAALERHDRDVAGATPTEGTRTYQIRTNPISVTDGDARYPYPATENWQKAIGAHSIWIEATVTVTVTRVRDAGSEPLPGGVPAEGSGSSTDSGPPTFSRHFHVEMTIHAEDMYNFNPGATDIATGTPDSANGRFELTGLGHEYLNRGTFSQPFDFDATMEPAASPASYASPSEPGRPTRTSRPAARRPYPTTR
jgi:hypothetical protein